MSIESSSSRAAFLALSSAQRWHGGSHSICGFFLRLKRHVSKFISGLFFLDVHKTPFIEVPITNVLAADCKKARI